MSQSLVKHVRNEQSHGRGQRTNSQALVEHTARLPQWVFESPCLEPLMKALAPGPFFAARDDDGQRYRGQRFHGVCSLSPHYAGKVALMLLATINATVAPRNPMASPLEVRVVATLRSSRPLRTHAKSNQKSTTIPTSPVWPSVSK